MVNLRPAATPNTTDNELRIPSLTKSASATKALFIEFSLVFSFTSRLLDPIVATNKLLNSTVCFYFLKVDLSCR